MSPTADLNESRYGSPPYGRAPVAPMPWWATATGVAVIVGLWALAHLLVSWLLESSINVDDAIESYLVQSFQISYVPRNPPLFDWLLYGLLWIFGPGPLPYAILRYGLLFTMAMLVYRVARQVIADPRLQALAVFSLSLLWVIGYHSHRILTHSNVMIVAIAGSFLTLTAVTRKPSALLYAGLGAWIAVGLLGKFGFVPFIAVLLIAGLLEPSFRAAILDRRIALTVLVAAGPLAVYALALHVLKQDVVAATAEVVGRSSDGSTRNVLDTFAGAWVGYLLPFVALAAAVFLPLNRGEDATPSTPERAAPRRVLRTIIILGTVVTLIGALAIGVTTLRDRYFHVFFLLATVYVFAELERLGGWQQRVKLYLWVVGIVAFGVLAVRAAITLWPDPFLCGRCVAAEPLKALRPVIASQFGDAPTLVAEDRMSAGRLRAAIPNARVVIPYEDTYRPPVRPATGCARIAGIANGIGNLPLPKSDGSAIELWFKWWGPLLRPRRQSLWQITPLKLDDPMCR
ncbi:ArnT family glycosyltransferase [Azorhizobium doebereinerae]|uniref:ArnT family glycosyltransferase n=1 Tax=Azorhizobium doebereinerae TaxID=281091 RepID=UPI00048BF9CA|nr:glycosyltransferase family 39 protein [Azorhizobium doebereinerae]